MAAWLVILIVHSTSLIYRPAVYALEEEITELAKATGLSGGRITHLGDEVIARSR